MRRTKRRDEDEVLMTQAVAWRIGRGYLRTRTQRTTYAHELAEYYRVSYRYALSKIMRMLEYARSVDIEKQMGVLPD